MNIFHSIESMRFRSGAKTCRLIRNETHTVIIFRFVKIYLEEYLGSVSNLDGYHLQFLFILTVVIPLSIIALTL